MEKVAIEGMPFAGACVATVFLRRIVCDDKSGVSLFF
jgi:hypothetical protein